MTSTTVSVYGGVEVYNERPFCVKYRSQPIQTSFYESTPSASDCLGNTIPPGDIEDPGNARADFPNASEERNLRNISRHSRVLFERIHGTQASGGWRPVIGLKQLNHHIVAAPQVFTCLRHRVAAYLHHQGISVIPYLDNWFIHHPDRQVLLRHQSQLLNILNMVGLRLNEAKSELEPVQDVKFLGLPLLLD